MGRDFAMRRIVVVATVLMLSALACGLPGRGDSTESGPTPAGPAESEESGSVATSESGGAPTPTDQPDVPLLPVPLNEGLASLDSYRMTYINDVYDSASDERSVITFVVARDDAADASYNSNESQVTDEDYQVKSMDLQEQYFVGNQVCVLSNGEAEFSTISSTAREMMGLVMGQVIQFNPLIENPEYVGEDVIRGIPVHTYTFEVRSIASASEDEVSKAEGHYAIAVDGEYLVDYRLDMEVRTAPEGDAAADFSISFFALTLEDINQPVGIEMPANCLAGQ
jgi:hypothetical protein